MLLAIGNSLLATASVLIKIHNVPMSFLPLSFARRLPFSFLQDLFQTRPLRRRPRVSFALATSLIVTQSGARVTDAASFYPILLLPSSRFLRRYATVEFSKDALRATRQKAVQCACVY